MRFTIKSLDLGVHILNYDSLMQSSFSTLIDAFDRRLVPRGETITVVESCTGGALASALTGMSGSSQWFRLGLVTYADQFKTDLLGVSQKSLESEGAVSRTVVQEMVKGAIKLARADYGIAISGIAGPGGGTKEKPVGMVWFGFGYKGHVEAVRMQFSGDRNAVRVQSVEFSLRKMLQLMG